MLDTTLIASQLMNGLVLGFLYVLIAVGMSIIFGMLGLVNFAHGAFFALGAYLALSLRPFLGFAGALVVAPLLVGLISLAVERTLLRRLYDKEPLLGQTGRASCRARVCRAVCISGGRGTLNTQTDEECVNRNEKQK